MVEYAYAYMYSSISGSIQYSIILSFYRPGSTSTCTCSYTATTPINIPTYVYRLNDLQHIPHQPSSSILVYHINHNHLVSSNPRLVRIHVAIVRQCNLFNCIFQSSDYSVKGSEV